MIVKLFPQILVHLSSVDFQVYLFSVLLAEFSDQGVYCVSVIVGDLQVVHMPYNCNLFSVDCIVCHSPIVGIYFEPPLL